VNVKSDVILLGSPGFELWAKARHKPEFDKRQVKSSATAFLKQGTDPKMPVTIIGDEVSLMRTDKDTYVDREDILKFKEIRFAKPDAKDIVALALWNSITPAINSLVDPHIIIYGNFKEGSNLTTTRLTKGAAYHFKVANKPLKVVDDVISVKIEIDLDLTTKANLDREYKFSLKTVYDGNTLKTNLFNSFNLYSLRTVQEDREDKDGNPIAPLRHFSGHVFVDSPLYGIYLYAIYNKTGVITRKLKAAELKAKQIEILANPPQAAQRDSDLTILPSHINARTPASKQLTRFAVGAHNVVFVTDTGGAFRIDLKTNRLVSDQFPILDTRDIGFNLPDERLVDCAWIDGYFFLLTQGGQLFSSNLEEYNPNPDEPNTIEWPPAQHEYASMSPDEGVGLAVWRRRLYVLGRTSIEQWYNYGTLDFPFRRDQNYTIHTGCRNRDTIQVMPQGIFFLSDDGIVYLLSGSGPIRVSNENLEYEISKATTFHSYIYTDQGHKFYSLNLYDADYAKPRNWTFDATAGIWTERDRMCVSTEKEMDMEWPFVIQSVSTIRGISFATGDGQWKEDVYMPIFKMNPEIGTVDYPKLTSGNNPKTVTRQAPILREAIGPVLNYDQCRAFMHSFQLDIPTEEELPENSTLYRGNVVLHRSEDNKKTWKEMGRKYLDEYRLKWNACGHFQRNRHLRVRIRTRNKVEVLGAYAEIQSYGKMGMKGQQVRQAGAGASAGAAGGG